jgi:uncharacterized repeat protein (TIGR01451 family)
MRKTMRRTMRPMGFGTIAACLCAIAMATTGAPKVEVSVNVEREVARVDANGKKVVERKPVDVANPGDVLVYTLKATNLGDGAAIDARIEDPIPTGTELLLDSIEFGQLVPTASLDGGASWQAFPAQVEQKAADGTIAKVAAPADAYTHLRWTLADPLAPGESKEVHFKVRIR